MQCTAIIRQRVKSLIMALNNYYLQESRFLLCTTVGSTKKYELSGNSI